MAIDPTSHFVYVANQNDGTISQYTVGIRWRFDPDGQPQPCSLAYGHELRHS